MEKPLKVVKIKNDSVRAPLIIKKVVSNEINIDKKSGIVIKKTPVVNTKPVIVIVKNVKDNALEPNPETLSAKKPFVVKKEYKTK